ncbi:helix-turn-helix transcriptional regulator [Microcoleus sp. herbarium7]|uniref:PadR family transcriptional regulator n=1 Tax=Microcoleus sp. herbarium7 TaxID=3055435 RepID=UPI002FD15D35
MPSQTGISRLSINGIHEHFQSPQLVYLSQEQAVCYVLHTLLTGDVYGTGLINALEKDFPQYRLSDTILYSALQFLDNEGITIAYWKKVEGRGRPRRMYKLAASRRKEAQSLALFWSATELKRFL